MSKTKVLICPYCGETQPHDERCRSCSGLFEPLSRQATHNAMGPWFLRDPDRPFQPGCSYETLVRLVDRGVVTRYSIIRGPTSKQFWTVLAPCWRLLISPCLPKWPGRNQPLRSPHSSFHLLTLL